MLAQSIDTPPFQDPSKRMPRLVDDEFAQAMSAVKVLVRMLGPRRVGKTSLVGHYCESTRTPLLSLNVPPIPGDVSTAAVVVDLLRSGLQAFGRGYPNFTDEYRRVAAREEGVEETKKVGGEISVGLGVFKGKLSHSKESTPKGPQEGSPQDLTAIGLILGRIDFVAGKLGVRPVVLFDEVQELVVAGDPILSALWAIRNEVQGHTHCRYVFAGSNQRLFSRVQEGERAPLLNMGKGIRVPPVSLVEIDRWAVPMLRAGGRVCSSVEPAVALLAGKIGEVVEVLDELWRVTAPGKTIEEADQRQAVNNVVRRQSADGGLVRKMTRPQLTVLRWILSHPGESPYAIPAMNHGTVKNAVRALEERRQIEGYGDHYAAASPLVTMKSLEPATLAEKLELQGRPPAPAQGVGVPVDEGPRQKP